VIGERAVGRDDDMLDRIPIRVALDAVVQVRNLLELDEEGFSPVAVSDVAIQRLPGIGQIPKSPAKTRRS
jgi:hypothetical protein